MKKLFIAAIAVFGFATANAQYVAEKGDFQTSINFRPFNNGDNEMFSNVGFNAAYFVSNKDAIRLNLNIDSESTKDADSKFEFGINLGYERHFKAYDRVDLYAGGQLKFKTSTEKDTYAYGDNKKSKYRTGGETSFGVGAFTGINFYVYKKLYIGTEIEFAFEHASQKKVQKPSTENGELKLTESDTAPSSNKLGFNVTPALKLGWTF